MYSKFLTVPENTNLEDFLIKYFMKNVIPSIDYPIIITDSLDVPFSWINIDIENKTYEELNESEQKKIDQLKAKLKGRDSVIPLKKTAQAEKPYSYVYFGESSAMKQLRNLPYLGIVISIIFVILGIYGLMAIKQEEKNLLWVGLAKETAHQFGTPISSLLGWLDILKLKIKKRDDSDELHHMLDYMLSDVKRLNKIASRFGKVGSKINKKPTNADKIINETIKYFQKRLPTQSDAIELSYESKIDGEKINIDPDLFTWTLENLIKNSIDAMKNRNGKIIVTTFLKKQFFYLRIADEGIGIPQSMQKKIFHPGMTSKKRGWGLGLSLAKRIIEDFHEGKIRILKSEKDKGTTFEIKIPIA